MKMLPREKLAAHGPHALEDHELLSLVMGSGSRKESVFALAQRIFKGFNREEFLGIKSLKSFQELFGLTPVKAGQIMASIELGKRLFQKSSTMRQIQTVSDVYQIVKNMQFLKKEYVRGLYLNTRSRIIHDEIISIGSLDANIIHPREIFRPAIEYGAYGFILAHNHPSGDCSPSDSDKAATRELCKIAELMQIPLMDHFIIGENDYFSFSEKKLLCGTEG